MPDQILQKNDFHRKYMICTGQYNFTDYRLPPLPDEGNDDHPRWFRSPSNAPRDQISCEGTPSLRYKAIRKPYLENVKWTFQRKYNHFEKKVSKIDKKFVSQSILEVDISTISSIEAG